MDEHPIMFRDDDPGLARLRAIALGLPGAEERLAHGRPWFHAGRAFAIYGGGTRGPDRVRHPFALLCRVEPDELTARRQDPRFFVPGYVGPSGWLGIDLDGSGSGSGSTVDGVGSAPTAGAGSASRSGSAVDWTEIAELVDASYRLSAPASLVRELDSRG